MLSGVFILEIDQWLYIKSMAHLDREKQGKVDANTSLSDLQPAELSEDQIEGKPTLINLCGK